MQSRKLIVVFIIVVTLMSGCSLRNNDQAKIKEDINGVTSELGIVALSDEWTIENSMLNGLPILDNQLLYDEKVDLKELKDDKKEDLDILYVTILPSYDEGGGNITFNDLNKIRDFNVETPVLDVYFQLGIDEGPIENAMQFDVKMANATITMRGHSTRRAEQKSYKIKLSDNVDLWHGQTTLNLNKSPYDPTRILNALAFDLLEEIPDIASIQTQFVKLYVKDLSTGNKNSKFVNYGYFTHLEQINRKYLQAHNLDRSGDVYKIERYEFEISDKLKNVDDPDYDGKAFAELLEHKVGKDHEKLLMMLDDVNNLSIPINETMDKHFNEDNYLTWLAFNILVGNYDTQTQNYFLYSPQNALTWYFMPWDYDGGFGNDNISNSMEEGRYQGKRHNGIAQYWNTTLHKRYFKYPENVEKLSAKIDEVYTYLTEDKMDITLSKYESYFKHVVTTMPDLRHIEDNLGVLLKEYSNLKTVPSKNRDIYYSNMNDPMPIWMAYYKIAPKKYEFRWDNSFDLQGDEIRYKIEIAKNPFMKNPVVVVDDLIVNTVEQELKSYGTYYWRVTVKDSNGNYQYGNDTFVDDNDNIHQGVQQFIVRK